MQSSDSTGSTHFTHRGDARMVDVTDKPVTRRVAVAVSEISMNASASRAIDAGDAGKGDVLAVARLAGISASKWTSVLIPLCHAIPIESVTIDFQWVDATSARPPETEDQPENETGGRTLRCRAMVATSAKTGVEMEALTAASITALTVYDMLKSVDRAMTLSKTYLESKTGGKSGTFRRPT